MDSARSALHQLLGGGGSALCYAAPWQDRSVMQLGSMDLIFSQAVMEYVDDLAGTYTTCRDWLRPAGLMLHKIDFRCHSGLYLIAQRT